MHCYTIPPLEEMASQNFRIPLIKYVHKDKIMLPWGDGLPRNRSKIELGTLNPNYIWKIHFCIMLRITSNIAALWVTSGHSSANWIRKSARWKQSGLESVWCWETWPNRFGGSLILWDLHGTGTGGVIWGWGAILLPWSPVQSATVAIVQKMCH